MDEIYKDERFSHIPSDPAFKRIPRKERKVQIDKRFQSMFNDKKFKVKFSVDKRGRPVSNTSTENLRRFYACDSSEEEESEEDEAPNCKDSKKKDAVQNLKTQKKKRDVNNFVEDIKSSGSRDKGKTNEEKFHLGTQSSSQQESSDDGSSEEANGNNSLDVQDGSLDEKIRAKLQNLDVDYARGEGAILSDSSSDEESSEDEEADAVSHEWGKLDEDAEKTDESTHRLAVCNMDWDRIKATDLMVLLNSFLPKGGAILSVTVYPSEYGLKRMQEEDAKGPLELRATKNNGVKSEEKNEEEESEDENKKPEEEGFARERLRQYQLNRLKYYYAVVVCDGVSTGDALYKECDGMEYESSASRLDLRFIPDDITFDQEPRDTCTKLPDMTKYEPLLFVTTALQQSKVNLTWDETDPRRLKLNEKINSGNIDNLDENDLKVYVATSSSEEESGDEEGKGAAASKYKSLLASIDASEEKEREKGQELQITWGIDLKQKVEKRMNEGKPEELTPFQKYMLKRKEKRKARREEQLRKKQENKETSGEAPSENGSEDDVPSDVDLNDPYFKEEFQKDEFAHTQKEGKSKSKKKKKKHGDVESEDEDTKRKKAELELLLMDEDDGKKHFSLKDILVDDCKKKKKNKRKIEEEPSEKPDDFQINLKDNRFSALFTSHHYNIDPADPHYKKTKGMESLRLEKLNRREHKEEVTNKKQKMGVSALKDSELSLLVKNVKRKAQINK